LPGSRAAKNTGIMEYWNTGILEQWNDGIMGKRSRKENRFYPIFQHSIIPIFG
jgi:hypothetical protein